jgi:hypothetical protein
MKGMAACRDARDDALAAGFFDALIGNQDRHVGQFRYHEPNRVLGLLDHGFSFPVEGAYCRGAYFQQFRRREHVRVTDKEREALTRLIDDPELFGLAGVLEPDRAERLRWRAQRMLDLGVVLLNGSYDRRRNGYHNPLGYDTFLESQRSWKGGRVMIEIRFSTPRRRVGELEWDPVAVVRVDGAHFEIEGDQDFAEIRDIEVLDVATGQSVTFDADPDRWARNLPQAFRSGDLICEAFDDSAPSTSARQALAAGA